MKVNTIAKELNSLAYHGRGIIIGKSADGKKAITAYFIMGRSVNSRNRVFVAEGEAMRTKAFDESKMVDPHLIIYYPVRVLGNKTIVTNGDQTDTIYELMDKQMTFEQALRTREFEDDKPNFTPRISGILNFGANDFDYKMSILKSADEKGTACNRYTFNYAALNGLGHFIHTYNHDGNPIPTFTGEPERVSIPNDIEEFFADIWNNLDENNKISMYVRYTDLVTGEEQVKMINKNA